MDKAPGKVVSIMKATGEESGYPFVIDRLMAAVYRRREVSFCGRCTEVPQGKWVEVPFKLKYREKIGEEALQALIDEVVRLSQITRRRMSIVLGPESCVYVEPDGRVWESDNPPSGGHRPA